MNRAQNSQQYLQSVEPQRWHVPINVALVHWECVTCTALMAKYPFFCEVTVS